MNHLSRESCQNEAIESIVGNDDVDSIAIFSLENAMRSHQDKIHLVIFYGMQKYLPWCDMTRKKKKRNEKQFIYASVNAWTWEYVINSRMILHIQVSYTILFARFQSNSFIFAFSSPFSFSLLLSFHSISGGNENWLFQTYFWFESKRIMAKYTSLL